MRAQDLISQKRDGHALAEHEIAWLVAAYMTGEVPDYQMASWLMAVFFRGMNTEETAALTLAMAHSGSIVDLSSVPGIKVDKHSTGGVADTITLILAPLVAAAGVPVAKMSGRGLGFTGGTIDKLEAIPGMQATLTQAEFLTNLKRVGLAITGQSSNVAPADGQLYALRDVTATIESIPLIASSIMSKKIAAGADKIVLDVKVGSGAFMKDIQQAIALASMMVHIGQLVKRETVAILSNMNEPLGQAVGNSLEVEEAIEVLSGRGPVALRTVCLLLGAEMLVLAGTVPDLATGQRLLERSLDDGLALTKFAQFVEAQGGDRQITHNRSLLPQAAIQYTVNAAASGYIQSVDAAGVGYSAMMLGAGRERKGDTIDLSVGLVMHCRIGDYVQQGQPLVTLYANKQEKIGFVEAKLRQAVVIAESRCQPEPLVLGIVDKDGYRPL